MLPPFAPAAETWARTMVESNICTRCAVSLIAARRVEESFESSGPAQAPEPLPDGLFQCPKLAFPAELAEVML